METLKKGAFVVCCKQYKHIVWHNPLTLRQKKAGETGKKKHDKALKHEVQELTFQASPQSSQVKSSPKVVIMRSSLCSKLFKIVCPFF